MKAAFSTPLAVVALCGTLLTGCADVSMRDYQRPDSPAKATWSRNSPEATAAAEGIASDWWKGFRDPALNGLIDQAIASNLDLRILAARSAVAESQIDEARAGAQPIIDVGAGVSFQKTTGQKSTTQYNVGTQLNWEIDIWGKVKKGVQAQTAEFRASEADWRAGYLSMVADVATTYFQILLLDEQTEDQQKALDKNRQILAIYEAMFANGLAPETQVRQQRAEINRLTKDLIELRRFRDLAANALGTLLGVGAGELSVPPGRLRGRVQVPEVPAGLPSQLLARRPDIVAAEFRVLSAYDLEGQAKLAQLPSVSLTARGGSASFGLSSLLKSFTFGVLPSINFPIFNPGIKARVKTSKAEAQVAEALYRRTVIGAFEEVENALVNLDAHRKQRAELEQQAEHLQVVATQVQAQLKEGLVSQLQVFESERSLLAAQLGLLASHQQILADTVTLYKALGGGWSDVRVANPGE
jgi:NodT family efflux transporter outer membrane factor (OMF) lipoprotein